MRARAEHVRGSPRGQASWRDIGHARCTAVKLLANAYIAINCKSACARRSTSCSPTSCRRIIRGRRAIRTATSRMTTRGHGRIASSPPRRRPRRIVTMARAPQDLLCDDLCERAGNRGGQRHKSASAGFRLRARDRGQATKRSAAPATSGRARICAREPVVSRQIGDESCLRFPGTKSAAAPTVPGPHFDSIGRRGARWRCPAACRHRHKSPALILADPAAKIARAGYLALATRVRPPAPK